MADAIELVDKDYSVAKKDRISSTQIKTRHKSFEAIARVWNKFRLSRIEKLLDMKKNSFVNDKFNADENSRLTKSAEKKLTKKSLAIAKLEEKIKICTNEIVPINYVNNRAIKIRKKMMDNLVANCDMSYSVDADSRDEIFNDVETENVNSINQGISAEEIASSLDEAMDRVTVGNDVNSETVDTPDVVTENVVSDMVVPVETEEVPSVAAGVPVDETTSEDVSTVNAVDVPSVGADEEINTDVVAASDETVNNESTVINAVRVSPVATAEDVNVVVPSDENVYDNVSTTDTTEVSPVDTVDDINVAIPSDETVYEDVNTIDEAGSSSVVSNEESNDSDSEYDFNLDDGKALFEITNPSEEETPAIVSETPIDYNSDVSNDNIVNNSEDDQIKVIKNSSSAAKIDKYKDDTERYEYKPMKAEEIEAARKNIEYDKYEKIYAEERRKVPVISFKDIFKPISAEAREELYNKIIESLSKNSPTYVNSKNEINDDRYVPLIVPEREESSRTLEVEDSNTYESDVTSVKSLKEQYLQLQRMLSSKEAKLKSINAQRDELVNKVADSDKDVENVNEILKQKRMMMTQYINDIQKKCSDIDSETLQFEEEIDMNKKRLEENMKFVSTTNDEIDEINQLLGDSGEYHSGRRIA